VLEWEEVEKIQWMLVTMQSKSSGSPGSLPSLFPLILPLYLLWRNKQYPVFKTQNLLTLKHFVFSAVTSYTYQT
jgi:hypothetical protein